MSISPDALEMTTALLDRICGIVETGNDNRDNRHSPSKRSFWDAD
ncbi:hypothetical protein [Sphingomonas oryzagri]|jgi:hypothetical protein|uniref:Transposase n=1 Tax=Sphingomonas oryzagri TaxID=3042314 RepID=A0ABT6N5M0_9SPHN|nr:hypothetical protein [Sphingomonas oryzagri]MDH7640414.1 hypothetical protein [Sphingomonas oryzagri]